MPLSCSLNEDRAYEAVSSGPLKNLMPLSCSLNKDRAYEAVSSGPLKNFYEQLHHI